MPTTLPTELATLFSNVNLLIGAFGLVTVIAIYSITGWKYARGLS